ncbi:bifunctional diaminohydroxyphosphoribosylaminopyrimidine deaminase/5-amino-6-(5-phosphoribosylamino)uracil reductase RibD [soil metagenome]
MAPWERASAGSSLAGVSEGHAAFMRCALALAERGWGQTAPNPMVGAVLVREGAILSEGWHERFGGPHAETNALAAAGERARGAHLYVTLEPCTHHGKTPPCTDAIIQAGVRAVSIAAPEPTRAAGGGADVLRRAGLEVQLGVEERRARELNAAFYHSAASDRPWVVLKLAVSADGAIAAPPGPDGRRGTRWLTGDAANAEVHRLRAAADAIAVGIGTVLADDPRLTVRHFEAPRVQPARVVFDRRARTPIDSFLVSTARETPAIIVVANESLPAVQLLRGHGVEVIVAQELPEALRLLRARGIQSLLVEGGAGIAGALLSAGCVDRLLLIEAPVMLGDGALDAFACVALREVVLAAFELREERRLGSDLLHVFALRESRV